MSTAQSHEALKGSESDKIALRLALISVSDKTNLIPFAKQLVDKHRVELISTGGTYRALKDANLPVIEIDSFTGFPEILDGRVKTLHPKVHGGLLAVRGNQVHESQCAKHEIHLIDCVIVNLYPFEETVKKHDKEFEKCVENVDIGGPAMVRSGSKNHRYVTVVTDVKQYDQLVEELEKNNGSTTYEFRKKLAAEAFTLTAKYDNAISNYFQKMCKQ